MDLPRIRSNGLGRRARTKHFFTHPKDKVKIETALSTDQREYPSDDILSSLCPASTVFMILGVGPAIQPMITESF